VAGGAGVAGVAGEPGFVGMGGVIGLAGRAGEAPGELPRRNATAPIRVSRNTPFMKKPR